MNFAAAPLNITGLQATDKLRITLDIGTTAVSALYLYINDWQNYIVVPVDAITGYQTFDLDLSSILSTLGVQIHSIYFRADVPVTVYADEISIVR